MSNKFAYSLRAEHLRTHVERIYRISPNGNTVNTSYLSLPTGTFRLGFNLAKRGYATDGATGHVDYPTNLLRGCASKPVVVQELRQQEQYSVVFKPFGLSRFTKVAVQELAREEVAAVDVFGVEATELSEKLCESSDSDKNFEMIESFLLKKFAPANTQMVEQALELINRGVYNVSQISSAIYCEERTLRRHFKKFMGISIKEQVRLVRLNKVWKDLTGDTEKKSLDVAFDNGFTDQAHFNNELKKLTGLTPREVRQIRIADHYQ